MTPGQQKPLQQCPLMWRHRAYDKGMAHFPGRLPASRFQCKAKPKTTGNTFWICASGAMCGYEPDVMRLLWRVLLMNFGWVAWHPCMERPHSNECGQAMLARIHRRPIRIPLHLMMRRSTITSGAR